MKKYISILIGVFCMISLIGCSKEPMGNSTKVTFRATILEIRDNHFLVEPVEGSSELKSANQITVPMKNMSLSAEPEVGDVLEITYDGAIAESYPAQIFEVYNIELMKAENEEGEISSSNDPSKSMSVDANWGVSLSVENITPVGLTIQCIQSGGAPTGDLQTGTWYIVETWIDGGWKEVAYIPHEYEFAWEAIAYMIPMNTTSKWQVNWEYIYGELPAGKYRIGKEIMDFRETGDYDTAIYYAEFEIME